MGIIKEYFLNSSLHGLHFISDKRFHWTERLFWIICVLASWVNSAKSTLTSLILFEQGASLALMLSAIEQYQTQKISFSVHTSYLDWKTNFPSIVLCEKSNEKMDEANDQ
jgi:amiloride-sensitive sodium channel